MKRGNCLPRLYMITGAAKQNNGTWSRVPQGCQASNQQKSTYPPYGTNRQPNNILSSRRKNCPTIGINAPIANSMWTGAVTRSSLLKYAPIENLSMFGKVVRG